MAENMREAEGGARVTVLLVATAVVSAIAGFLYGYDTGIISGAILQIRKDFGVGDGWQQAISAGILLGAVIGALVGGLACASGSAANAPSWSSLRYSWPEPWPAVSRRTS